MLDSFPKNRFYEERAIFLSRVGKYEMALDIYVNKLNDLGKAENYCIEHYHKDGKTQNIFSLYIKKLLSNNNNKYKYKNKDNTTENINDNDNTRLTNYIINIINEHYTKINPLDVIKLLPKKLNLSNILDYLILIIQKTTEVKRRCQITKNLEKSDNLNLKSKISKKGKRQFYIDQNVLCMGCGKRIGNSIIGIFPNGVYAHMSCIQNKYVCPKTNENFSDYSENFY